MLAAMLEEEEFGHSLQLPQLDENWDLPPSQYRMSTLFQLAMSGFCAGSNEKYPPPRLAVGG